MLFQSALISDHSCSLSPRLPRRQSQMGPCSPCSLVYSGKNQFDNSVTGRNFSLRLGSIFSHQGAASNASRIRAAAHIWAGVTRSCCYCPDELFFPLCSSNTELSHFITLNWSQGILPGSELWRRFVFTEDFSYLLPCQTCFFDRSRQDPFSLYSPPRSACCLSLVDSWFKSIHTSCPLRNYLHPKAF